MRWPAPPTHGAEGPLPETPYSQALRGVKSVLTAPYDQYGHPSMYMGPVGPVPIANLFYDPMILRGYPSGWRGPTNAYRTQGPLPRPAFPWEPDPEVSWERLIGKERK